MVLSYHMTMKSYVSVPVRGMRDLYKADRGFLPPAGIVSVPVRGMRDLYVATYEMGRSVPSVSVPVRGMRDLYGFVYVGCGIEIGFRPRQGNEGFV